MIRRTSRSYNNTLIRSVNYVLHHSYCKLEEQMHCFSTDTPNSNTNEVKTLPSIVPNEKVDKPISFPSYFGYLSGVATSLWTSSNWFQEVKNSAILKNGFRQPIVQKFNRTEVAKQTTLFVDNLLNTGVTNVIESLKHVESLNKHLMLFPASRMVAVQNPMLIPRLLKNTKLASDEELKAKSRQCLTLCGFVKPPNGQGIRLLSIDGGGTRGMMGLEVLGALEKYIGGRRICDLFDIIVGVSTGAIIATLIGAKRMQVSEAKMVYMDISQKLFDQGKFSGVSGLLLSHSYYNTAKWVEILKDALGEELSMINTACIKDCPKLAFISCVVNAIQLQPFVFRNYEHPAGRDSQYKGSTQHKVWQAIQASAAAPGYFAEVLLDNILHQDGGVLVNNPTGIALHEARLLWPNELFQTVVSIGNGRSIAEVEINSTATSTWVHEKLSKIVDSATDTELVHNCVSDLLPANVYYRFNPYMSHPYTLDEIRAEKLAQMERDAKLYTRRNSRKIAAAAAQLTKSVGIVQLAKRKFNPLMLDY